MRSVSPPWPGMSDAKSLMLRARLKPDARKPPKGAMSDAKTAMQHACSAAGESHARSAHARGSSAVAAEPSTPRYDTGARGTKMPPGVEGCVGVGCVGGGARCVLQHASNTHGTTPRTCNGIHVAVVDNRAQACFNRTQHKVPKAKQLNGLREEGGRMGCGGQRATPRRRNNTHLRHGRPHECKQHCGNGSPNKPLDRLLG